MGNCFQPTNPTLYETFLWTKRYSELYLVELIEQERGEFPLRMIDDKYIAPKDKDFGAKCMCINLLPTK